jgi:bifunctional DNA-binding transcriptional regulator/antitoxin component of YhaV-PrlF toxin-antitoxin module
VPADYNFPIGYRVTMDSKRRPTLPAALLEEAGIDPASELIAHADGKGRIILDDPQAMLAAFQTAVLQGMAETGFTGSAVDDLLADRATDPSATW